MTRTAHVTITDPGIVTFELQFPRDQATIDWVKTLPAPDRTWNPHTRTWTLTALPEPGNPAEVLTRRGFTVTGLPDTLDEYQSVLVDAHPTNPTCVVLHPRLTGFAAVEAELGGALVWDNTLQRAIYPLSELTTHPAPRQVTWPERLRDRAAALPRAAVPEHLGEFADELAHATNLDGFTRESIAPWTARIPDWFGLDLFPYQQAGALAVALGRTLLADQMGVGKCVAGHTRIPVNGDLVPIARLWEHRAHRATPDSDGVGDVIALAPGEVPVTSVTGRFGFRQCHASHLYRQRYHGPLVTVTTERGHTLTMTPQHRLRTPVAWTPAGELLVEDAIAIPAATRASGTDLIPVSEVALWCMTWPEGAITGFSRTILAAMAQAGATRELAVALRRSLAALRLRECSTAQLHQYTLHTTHLDRLLASPVQWVRISDLSITTADCDIYDLTVPDTHNYVAEGMYTHNTRTALAAASIWRPRRTAVVCPPVMVDTWARNVEDSGLARAVAGEVVTVRAGKRVPPLPERGVVVVPDSFLAAREELQHGFDEWAPQVAIVDEAHRAMNLASRRSRAMVRLAAAAARSIAVTGTPLLALPHQLAPLLAISGQLHQFGGYDEFYRTWCVRNRFGGWAANRRALPVLRERLDADVWVRRTKAQVLPMLPAKLRAALPVTVSLRDYDRAHADVNAALDDWITGVIRRTGQPPTPDEVDVFAQGNLAYISQLRRAAGMAKLDAAVDWIALRDPDAGPLVVWGHHREVLTELEQRLRAANRTVASIVGDTSSQERARVVEVFQAGGLDVLVCSITAAGVGITLTRASDVLFVETDWTPALVEQAEDRCHRFGQVDTVTATTMIATGTLDEHLQSVLARKGLVLGAVTGTSDDVAVAATSRLQDAAGLLAHMVSQRIAALLDG